MKYFDEHENVLHTITIIYYSIKTFNNDYLVDKVIEFVTVQICKQNIKCILVQGLRFKVHELSTGDHPK